MNEFDRLGRDAFLQEYGFGEATTYLLVTDTGRYDSKAIFGAAYQRQHGVTASSSDFSGGKAGAAGRLVELGFEIEGIDDKSGRRTFATFDEALKHYRIPFENLPLVREFLSSRRFSEFYIPRSGSYIGALHEDGIKNAFIHSGYIWHRLAKGTEEGIALPVNRLREGGNSRATKRDQPKELCRTHFTELPASGVCPYC